MMNARNPKLILWILPINCLMYVSLANTYTPEDNYLIDCGSLTNKSVGDRVFVADDDSDSNFISNPRTTFVNTSSGPASSTIDSVLYQTARIFDAVSTYTFVIKKKGRLWIRLHFFPFVQNNHNLSMARFSVTAQNFTLLKDFRVESGPLVKEYSLNITSDKLRLTFEPSPNSFAFINALEVFSLPDELTPLSARSIGSSSGSHQNLQKQALETVSRVNMGNRTVSRQDDNLWRLWVSDDVYLRHRNLAKFVSNVKAVNFSNPRPTEMIAPASVYGTATLLNADADPRINANVTWNFEVDPGFEYLVRFHFCDIVNKSQQVKFFNVYINSWFAYHYFDLYNLTSNVVGAPYSFDVVVRVSDNPTLNVSVGPSTPGELDPFVILNGLEIMKINNSRGSLVVADSISSTSSKTEVGLIAGLAVGAFVAFVSALVILLVCRRRKSGNVNHSKEEEEFALRGEGKFNGTTTVGYRFPFAAIQEATDNFTESLVIGVGGFGKVYVGVLGNETKVAVKRGVPQSQQGFAEFRTEIEMLSQFRHRHLVSLIGYCDEGDEMIIIYEYMENGTLKNHLYGSDLPGLSWRQRLEICVGAARGLHYLHTSSAKAIIHRDVKSANILLDENMMAKVADFGLSKTGPGMDESHVSTAVKGSFGYLDPEYLTRQVLTEKSDVYSFGVVMLEVLCGRPVVDPSRPREQVNLIDWAMKWYRRGQLEEIVDPRLSFEMKPDSMKKFSEIIEKCLAERGVDRPTMGDVLWNLEFALQLQGNEVKSIPDGQSCPETNSFSHLENNVSSQQFSVVSMGDIAGVSMSEVFAQMVRVEMR